MWNVARAFSFTRDLERQLADAKAECCPLCPGKDERIAELKAEVVELKAEIKKRDDYILFLNGKPPINRESAAVGTVTQQPLGLRGAIRSKQAAAVGRMLRQTAAADGSTNGKTMEERADDFALKVGNGNNGSSN